MSYPLIIEPDQLEPLRHNDDIVIVDLSQPGQYVNAHIPEAHYLPYGTITRARPPIVGLLPDAAVFSRILGNLGIDAGKHVVACDDEGGGCAARFIWTLHVFGHRNTSLLNGGIASWINEGHETSALPPLNPVPTDYSLTPTDSDTADYDYIRQHLDDDRVALLDARSEGEYRGSKKLADKAGHIPGAKHFEWTEAMDRQRNFRLLPAGQIETRLQSLGLDRNREIICYCQSHHRSAYTWLVLKALGYENVRGYPGSWSDWGNRADAPVETDTPAVA